MLQEIIKNRCCSLVAVLTFSLTFSCSIECSDNFVTGFNIRILEVIESGSDSVKVREISMLGNKGKAFVTISVNFASDALGSKKEKCIDEIYLKADSILSADLIVFDDHNNRVTVVNSNVSSAYSSRRFYENNNQLGYCSSLPEFIALFNSCVSGTSDFYPGIFKDWIIGFDVSRMRLSRGMHYTLQFKTNFWSGKSVISKVKFTYS